MLQKIKSKDNERSLNLRVCVCLCAAGREPRGVKNAGRRPWFAWLQQHCQGHEGCSCHTHTNTHAQHKTIFRPTPGLPTITTLTPQRSR